MVPHPHIEESKETLFTLRALSGNRRLQIPIDNSFLAYNGSGILLKKLEGVKAVECWLVRKDLVLNGHSGRNLMSCLHFSPTRGCLTRFFICTDRTCLSVLFVMLLIVIQDKTEVLMIKTFILIRDILIHLVVLLMVGDDFCFWLLSKWFLKNRSQVCSYKLFLCK